MHHEIQDRLPLHHVRQTPTVRDAQAAADERKRIAAGFSARLKQVYGWKTQVEVGELWGTDPKYVGELMRGNRLPMLQTILKVDERYNLNWLLRGTGAPLTGFELQLPDELRERIEKRAVADGRALGDEILAMLGKYLDVAEIVEK